MNLAMPVVYSIDAVMKTAALYKSRPLPRRQGVEQQFSDAFHFFNVSFEGGRQARWSIDENLHKCLSEVVRRVANRFRWRRSDACIRWYLDALSSRWRGLALNVSKIDKTPKKQTTMQVHAARNQSQPTKSTQQLTVLAPQATTTVLRLDKQQSFKIRRIEPNRFHSPAGFVEAGLFVR